MTYVQAFLAFLRGLPQMVDLAPAQTHWLLIASDVEAGLQG